MDGASSHPTRQELLAWVARALAAAALLAVLELLLITLVLVGAVSSGLMALQTWAALSGLLAIFGAAVAPLLWQADRSSLRRLLPQGVELAAGLVLGGLATLIAAGIDRALFLPDAEFPGDIERMRQAARLIFFGVTFALALLTFRWSAKRASRLAASWQRLLAGLSLGLLALVAVLTGHFAFAPVHQVGAAAVCSLSALPLIAVVLRLWDWPTRALDAKAVSLAVLVVGLLGAVIPGAARDHAKFVVWSHSSLAGFAERLRDALDRDGDAVLPAWLLGGGDCAAGDPGISPLQIEVPGDGIDQDCRGGDAPRVDPEFGAVQLPAGCAPLEPRPDVLVLTVDALRFDALGPQLMPSLTELATRSQVFARAYSPTVMTVTSVTALLSGRAFADVGPKNALIDTNLTPTATAPELFGRAGYRTAAFSDFFDHQVFHRGFRRVNGHWRDARPGGVKGELTSVSQFQGILEWLDSGREPAFVWAHIADTHGNYSLNRDDQGHELSETDAYCRGVSYVDQQLGRLFAELKRRGRLERTIIAVLADHGEELLARGRQGHGPNLFEESIHVPLVLWVPGCAGHALTQPVGLARLVPTLGALSGVRVPGFGLFDDSGLPTVVEAVTGLNTTYKRAVIGRRYKLMLDVANGGRMLFDLEADPQELTDILADAPEQAQALEQAYQRWLDAPGRR